MRAVLCLYLSVFALSLAGFLPAQVDMERSFRIPHGAAGSTGASVSHTPAVVFTKDGKTMLTATSGGEIVAFAAGTQKILKRVAFPEKVSAAVSIDPAGRFVVWALANKGVAVMDLASGKILRKAPEPKANWLAVSPDGSTVAVACGKVLQLRDVEQLAVKWQLTGHEAEITCVAWSADGQRIGTASKDGRLLVHDVSTKTRCYEVKKAAPLYAVSFHPKGNTVAYGGHDKQVYEYDFATEKEKVLSKGQPFWITSLGYSPDGGLIAVGDESCDIWLYDLASGNRIFHNKHHVECWLSSVAWAPDNETFLFGCCPNSHAGKPSLHLPLTRAEAARTEAVRRSRAALIQAIDAQIASIDDQKQKRTLAACKTSLQAEEKAVPSSAGIVLAGSGAGAGPDAVAQTASLWSSMLSRQAPSTALPQGIQKLLEQHRKVLHKEIEKLQYTFCINQWKVHRKKLSGAGKQQ